MFVYSMPIFLLFFDIMQQFLSSETTDGRIELTIDTALFSPQIAMKSAYTLLDRAYFFFSLTGTTLTVQVTPKE
jgi:hypothetical protein